MSEEATDPVGSDDRTQEDFIADTVSLLNVKVVNIHSRRALLYKVADDIAKLKKFLNGPASLKDPRRLTLLGEQYFTENAWKIFVANDKKSSKGLHLEHPVPKSKVTHWLCGDKHTVDEPVARDKVERAIKFFMRTCWVTGRTKPVDGEKECHEQDILDRSYYDILDTSGDDKAVKVSFRNNMPRNWKPDSEDFWDRYVLVRKHSDKQLSNWKTRSDHETYSQQSPTSERESSVN